MIYDAEHVIDCILAYCEGYEEVSDKKPSKDYLKLKNHVKDLLQRVRKENVNE